MKTGVTPKVYENYLKAKGYEKWTKLRRRRVDRGLSQGDLAKASGVSPKTIQAYEQNREDISRAKIKTLVAMCIVLDCRIDEILEDGEFLTNYKKVK